MAWFGVESIALRTNIVVFSVYWAVLLVLLVTAVAMVLLDLRYIRLQYILGKREIFQETLGDEEFRRRLKAELRDRTEPDTPKR